MAGRCARIEEYHQTGSPLVSRGENLAGTSRQPGMFPNHLFADTPTMDELQRHYLCNVLEKTRGCIGGSAGAAGILGTERTTCYKRIKKLGLSHGNKHHLLNANFSFCSNQPINVNSSPLLVIGILCNMRISCHFLHFDQTEDIWLKSALKVKGGVLLTSESNLRKLLSYFPVSSNTKL